MGDPDGRVGRVDVLATGSLRPVRVDSQVVVDHLDLGILHLGDHIDTGKRGMSPSVGVER